MTKRFVPPEPSPKAHAAAATIINDTVDQLGGFDAGGDALRAAYAIDLPVIVQSEVERALDQVLHHKTVPYNRTRVKAQEYVAQRFGGCICTRAHTPLCPSYVAGTGEPARFGEGEAGVCPICRESLDAHHCRRPCPRGRPELQEATCATCGAVRHPGRPWPGITVVGTSSAPSAPAEPLTLRPEGRIIPGVPVPFTESERAFLRLFVRDYLAQVDLPAGLVRGADTVAAARALLAEGER